MINRRGVVTVILILAQYGAGKRIERKETESVSKPWLIQNAIDMIHVLRKEKIKFHWINLPKSKSSNAFFSNMFDPPCLNLPIFLNLPMLFELTYHWKIKGSPVICLPYSELKKKFVFSVPDIPRPGGQFGGGGGGSIHCC